MVAALSGPPSREERRAYARGYVAGRHRRDRDVDALTDRADAAVELFECLVDGLIVQGLTLDEVLDAQLLGAQARRGPIPPDHPLPA